MTDARRPDATATRRDLRALFDTTRARTLELVDPLDDDQLHGQFHGFLSPVVWDIGHVGNFEELWLLRQVGGADAHDPALDELYNAFENPRWTRGELPLLSRDEALPYLDQVRRDAQELIARMEVDGDDPLVRDGYVVRMLAQHESQHQETVLQSLDLREDSLYGGFRADRRQARRVDDTDTVVIRAGRVTIGTDDRAWAYDNERPRHTVEVADFAIDRFPVTARRFAAFVEDGGYDDDRWWSPRGREWRVETGHRWPQGWLPRPDGGYDVRRFGHVVPLDPREPVQHVSHFEAEAFAAWAGGRLPTEAEWEVAAAWDPGQQRARRFPWGDAPPTPSHANVGLRHLHPQPVGAYPAGASAYGVEQLAGDVYEWTASPFEGYPGFQAFPYREYSEVFFGGDYRVLRGSSWAIAAPVARATYRNWDHPYRRQIVAGLRVAYDLGAHGTPHREREG